MLNQLYTECDHVLAQYDSYKVETIGDAYMVVSGLPKLNMNRHSGEICSTALNMLMMLEEFKVPHNPTDHLMMRIGIHTGTLIPAVAYAHLPMIVVGDFL